MNASFALARPLPAAGGWVRWAHMTYDLGQALALGLCGWVLFGLWGRLASTRRRWLLPVVMAASVALSAFTLVDDLENFLHRHELEQHRHVVAAAVSLGIPCAALVGALLSRAYLRWFGVAIALAAAVANQLVLTGDYPGAHLYLAWGSTTLGSWALVGARSPRALAVLSRNRAITVPAGVVATAGAVASLAVWPSPAVVVDVFQNDGAVLFPYLADARSEAADEAPLSVGAETDGGVVHPAWRKPRSKAPDVPPTRPTLAPERPIVILLSIDSMRADTLTDPALRDRLPNMARMADRGVHFTQARASGSTTRNTLGSLFASKHRSALRWGRTKRLGNHLRADRSPRLPARLAQAGFATAHVVSYGPLGNPSRITGVMDEELLVRSKLEQRFALSHEVLDVAIPLIERRKDDKLFLFMHWMDPHYPHDAAGTHGGRWESYLRELEICDAQVGRLWTALERMGLHDRVVFFLIADHGQAFGAHGIRAHGTSLYDVLVRVPMVVRVPGVEPRRVDVPVSTLDVAPAILDLVGAPAPGSWLGQSLVGFLRGESPTLDRPMIGDHGTVTSLIVGGVKVMDDRRKHVLEIYDLKEDPKELRNLAGSEDEEHQRLVDDMRAFFASHQVGKKTKKPMD